MRYRTILFAVVVAVTIPAGVVAAPLQELVQTALHDHSPWLLPLAFLAGVLSVATPCVLPMVPIVLGTIGITGATTRREALIRSGSYVAGITVMYAALGFLAARTGTMLGSAFTHPTTHVAIAVLYVALALAAFDVYEFRLPSVLATRASAVGRASTIGAFGAGLVSGFLALPCVGPILAGLLAYVGAQRDAASGALVLGIHALGFGLPFFCVGVGLLRLPRRGSWMRGVKVATGIALLVGAGWFMRNAFPADAPAPAGWCAERPDRDCLAASCTAHALTVVDFSAVWCAACAELDRRTFRDPNVSEALARHGRVRVDVDRAGAAAERFTPRGLPTVAFLDRTCTERGERIEGFVGPTKFLARLRRAEADVR